MPSGSVVKSRSALVRYAIPLIALGLSTILAVALRQVTAPNPPPPIAQVAFLLAIMGSAWWGGYVPGILACLLTLFLVPFALVPHFDPRQGDPIHVLLILLISVLISRVAQNRNRVEAALRRANESLDERVRLRTAELQRSNTELKRLNEDLNQLLIRLLTICRNRCE